MFVELNEVLTSFRVYNAEVGQLGEVCAHVDVRFP